MRTSDDRKLFHLGWDDSSRSSDTNCCNGFGLRVKVNPDARAEGRASNLLVEEVEFLVHADGRKTLVLVDVKGVQVLDGYKDCKIMTTETKNEIHTIDSIFYKVKKPALIVEAAAASRCVVDD